MFSRIKYYLSSIPTIFRHIENWYVFILLLSGRKETVINLKNGLKFKIRNLMDMWVIKEICLDRDYEFRGTGIRNGWMIIDIGAGLGDFAVMIGKENPQCKIFAYEPSPDAFELLEENIELNRLKNISAHQIAVGGREEKDNLRTGEKAYKESSTKSDSLDDKVDESIFKRMSLDAIFDINRIQHCDFLKMDCEGCEFDVLLGASQSTLQMISQISLEYHNGFTQYTHADLASYLERNGFEIRLASNPVHSYLGFLYAHRMI